MFDIIIRVNHTFEIDGLLQKVYQLNCRKHSLVFLDDSVSRFLFLSLPLHTFFSRPVLLSFIVVTVHYWRCEAVGDVGVQQYRSSFAVRYSNHTKHHLL